MRNRGDGSADLHAARRMRRRRALHRDRRGRRLTGGNRADGGVDHVPGAVCRRGRRAAPRQRQAAAHRVLRHGPRLHVSARRAAADPVRRQLGDRALCADRSLHGLAVRRWIRNDRCTQRVRSREHHADQPFRRSGSGRTRARPRCRRSIPGTRWISARRRWPASATARANSACSTSASRRAARRMRSAATAWRATRRWAISAARTRSRRTAPSAVGTARPVAPATRWSMRRTSPCRRAGCARTQRARCATGRCRTC